jgi:hypothetical protein
LHAPAAPGCGQVIDRVMRIVLRCTKNGKGKKVGDT